MKPFATASLKTVNAWGGSQGDIDLDVQKWDMEKASVMKRLLWEACKQNPDVMSSLKSTTNEIYEDTLPDSYWGYCEGKGQNTIGILWAEIRDSDEFQQSIPQENKKRKHAYPQLFDEIDRRCSCQFRNFTCIAFR